MADTFTNDLRLRLQESGANSGQWGSLLNDTITNIASAFSLGSEAIPNASTHTITLADDSSSGDEARSLFLKCTGGGQACTVTLAPNTVSKVWIISNETSFTLTFSAGSGANVAVAAGAVKVIVTDGAGSGAAVVDALSGLSANVSDLTTTGDISFGDNDKAIFGAGSDLEILSNGTDGLIRNGNAAGEIRMESDDRIIISDIGFNEVFAVFNDDDDVKLYHNGNQKLATTSTGIALTSTGATDVTLQDTDGGFAASKINVQNGGRDLKVTAPQDIIFNVGSSDAVTILNGGNFGIGTSSPTQKLDVRGAVRFGSTISDVADGGRPLIYASDGSGSHTGHALVIQARDGAGSEIDFVTGTTPTTRVKIDSSGSFLVGKTEDGTSNAGHVLFGNGAAYHIRSGGFTNFFNRLSSDGEILRVAKDGTTVGSIGSQGGANIYITSGNRGVRLNDGDFSPITSANAYSDNSVDLGRSTARFQDLYLSGGVYLGGTTSNNLLDDAEEGTWTPVYQGGSSNPSVSYNIQQGRYTKVGRLVVAHCRIRTSAVSSQGSGYLAVGGLPFASLNVTNIFGSGIVSYTGGNTWTDDNAPSRSYVNSNSTQAILVRYDSTDPRDEGSTSVNAASLSTGSSKNDLIITFVYATE